MRLFTGIALTSVCRAAVAAAVAPLRADPAPVSWVAPGNLHITLKFLGEISPDRVGAAVDALAGAAASFRPFGMEAEGAGVFPGTRNPRVLWVGFREPLELVRELQENMENALSGVGFPREDRPFHPHITVGRARGVLPPAWGDRFVRALSGRRFGEVPVPKITLYESRLSPGGAVYTVVRDFLLSAEARGRREN
ncbi:MAG TPA: RNA 2',3'-cyclic phosphodiesterase [Candidatus Deferrimicrobiaceae bacterium]